MTRHASPGDPAVRFLDPGQPLPARAPLHLDNAADVAERADDVARADAVVLHFPKWTDGRAYTQARLLRSRLRYTGTIVATGEVLVDMLPLLQRCGFDTVQLRADQDIDAARRALGFFAGHYQADLVSKLPVWARLGTDPAARAEGAP